MASSHSRAHRSLEDDTRRETQYAERTIAGHASQNAVGNTYYQRCLVLAGKADPTESPSKSDESDAEDRSIVSSGDEPDHEWPCWSYPKKNATAEDVEALASSDVPMQLSALEVLGNRAVEDVPQHLPSRKRKQGRRHNANWWAKKRERNAERLKLWWHLHPCARVHGASSLMTRMPALLGITEDLKVDEDLDLRRGLDHWQEERILEKPGTAEPLSREPEMDDDNDELIIFDGLPKEARGHETKSIFTFLMWYCSLVMAQSLVFGFCFLFGACVISLGCVFAFRRSFLPGRGPGLDTTLSDSASLAS